jgi:tape measure domain-containing protein
MSTESAIAYVSVVPQAKGAGRAIEQQINPQALGVSVGSKMSGGFLKSVGRMAVKSTAIIGGGVAAIGATIAAVAAKKGIARLLDIDDAKGKLAGLKTSTKDIASIMDSALQSVRGTAFGLGDAAGVASNAVAAGIKPGQALTKYLKLTADAATIAGVSLDEMGSIINKTTTSGKVYTDNLNQLADRGIPIFQWLQKEYGVSADELSSMVSKGKVDAATFRKVIEENIGGAALASGKTERWCVTRPPRSHVRHRRDRRRTRPLHLDHERRRPRCRRPAALRRRPQREGRRRDGVTRRVDRPCRLREGHRWRRGVRRQGPRRVRLARLR